MKNVWILNHYAQEPGGSGGTRHHSLAKHLLKHGWQACIVAASVELNTGYQRLCSRETARLGIYDGVPFLWLKTPSYQGNGTRRVLNMVCYALRAIIPYQTRLLPRPDVVIGSSVHPLAAWSGAIVARRTGVPFFFEVRDLWPQTLIDMGELSPNSVLALLLRRLEKWLYRVAERILVLPPRAADYIEPLGISPAKIVWLPNGVDLADFPPPSLPAPHEAFVLMYFGAHGNANGLSNLILAMAELSRRSLPQPVCLRLIGEGPLKPSLIDQARQLKLANVFFEPPVPKQQIPRVAAGADAFVFNLIHSPVFRYGISSNKLFDFMASGRPLLFCSDAVNNPVREASAGLTVSPDDPTALADAVEELLHMSAEQRYEMGLNARRYIEDNHDYARLAEKLATVLDEVCQSRDDKKASRPLTQNPSRST